jgi:hypothetical protein
MDSFGRRPKKGDEDYIKRPENAFILFRRKCCEDRAAAAAQTSSSNKASSSTNNIARSSAETSVGDRRQRQADLSKTISAQWKSLSVEEKKYWEDLAREKRKGHEAMYPHYVYHPQRKRVESSLRRIQERRAKYRQHRSEGLYATRAYKIGELIRTEKLLMIVPQHTTVPTATQAPNRACEESVTNSSGEYENTITDSHETMTSESKERFIALWNCRRKQTGSVIATLQSNGYIPSGLDDMGELFVLLAGYSLANNRLAQ